MANEYAVMGDLGGGGYIVRMYVYGYLVDEEFTANSAEDLISQIEDRMGKITKSSAQSKGEKKDVFKSDGQAIPLTKDQGMGYEGRPF